MKKLIPIAIVALLIDGCSSIPVQPQAAGIMVSPNPAPKSCKYVGQVVGNQGDFFTGGFTSNKNLEQGAMNDLRNQASKQGANYVQLVTNRAGVTGSFGYYGGNSQETNVTNTGNAYRCPASAIG